MKTGFIGLGAMGMGMATNLAKAGQLHAVFNRHREKAEKLAAEFNLSVCPTVEALAEQVNVILICVSADEDVLEIIQASVQTITPGTVVIDMSTVSSDTARQAYSIFGEKQVAFLDAPVSGGVEGANKGTLSMMVGGDIEALETVRPLLETISTQIMHMGKTGSGQATKAVNQIMAAGINQAVTEALAFGQSQGLPMDKVIKVISGGAAGNWFLQHRGLNMTNDIFTPGFKVALHHKDLNICQKMAGHNEIDLMLTSKTLKDYQQLITDGYGDEDISALYRLKKKP